MKAEWHPALGVWEDTASKMVWSPRKQMWWDDASGLWFDYSDPGPVKLSASSVMDTKTVKSKVKVFDAIYFSAEKVDRKVRELQEVFMPMLRKSFQAETWSELYKALSCSFDEFYIPMETKDKMSRQGLTEAGKGWVKQVTAEREKLCGEAMQNMESKDFEGEGFYYNSDLGIYVDFRSAGKSYYHWKLKMFYNPLNGIFYNAGVKFDPKNQVCISKDEIAFEHESGSMFNI